MISFTMRILLIIGALALFFYVIRKLRKSKLETIDTLFWLCLSLIFLILAIFPEVAIKGAELLGVVSPVNFVFLCIILLLILASFSMTIRIARLEKLIDRLVQEIALRESNRKINEEKQTKQEK